MKQKSVVFFRNEKELGSIDEAHDTMVWSMDWHPLGHILASGSNDHTTYVNKISFNTQKNLCHINYTLFVLRLFFFSVTRKNVVNLNLHTLQSHYAKHIDIETEITMHDWSY